MGQIYYQSWLHDNVAMGSLRSLSLSQVPFQKSAQRHHPASARQPHQALHFVSFYLTSFDSFLICDDWFNGQSLRIRIRSFAHSGSSRRIRWLALSHLSSATSPSSLLCTIRIASFIFGIFKMYFLFPSSSIEWLSFQRRCVVIVVVLHDRYLSLNQLTGTIPPQLGNLSKLRVLYVQNRIVIDNLLSLMM